MAGNRDSEIAMIIEDTETIPSYMNGKEVRYIFFKSVYTCTLECLLFLYTDI
jgi:hypothetical protein